MKNRDIRELQNININRNRNKRSSVHKKQSASIARDLISKKELQKLKNKKKQEQVNLKQEQKKFEKEQRKKFKKEVKNKKIKVIEKSSNVSQKKRMRNEIIVAWGLFFALIFRIAWIQFGMGSELQSMAYVQQTLDRSINPRRGTIYDATRKKYFSGK